MYNYALIFATDTASGFGNNNGSIPWQCSEDLKHFASVTKDGVLIMGRKTAESLIKIKKFPLPGREMIVLSRSIREIGGIKTVQTMRDALVVASQTKRKIFVIGGIDVLEATSNQSLQDLFTLSEVYQTVIDGEYDCDIKLDVDKIIPRNLCIVSVYEGNGYWFRTFRKGTCVSVNEQYVRLVKQITQNGIERDDRTGTGTMAVFAPRQLEFDIEQEFPLLDVKATPFRLIAEELFWFLSGKTDPRILQDKDVHIWDDDFAKFQQRRPEIGGLGPVYGFQWRHYGADYNYEDLHTMGIEDYNKKHGGVDQISRLIDGLKTNPHSRRHYVSAWNAADQDDMALPPCHISFQMFADNTGGLSCQMYQRSADVGLGLPFNIASYALLTHIIANMCNLKPVRLILVLGDAHLYKNHITSLNELIDEYPSDRVEPYPYIRVDKVDNLCSLKYEHIHLSNYKPFKKLSLPLST